MTDSLFTTMNPLTSLFFRLLFALALLLLPGLPAVAGQESEKLYDIEAAFIYQFTTYIEWKAEGMPPNQPFVISVLGKSPLLERLEVLAKTKTVKGRPVEIQKDPDQVQLKRSQIIVLSQTSALPLPVVLDKTAASGSLIIAHGEGLGKAGATINFFVEDGRVRFEINRTTAEKQGLQISSQLLKLAKIVE